MDNALLYALAIQIVLLALAVVAILTVLKQVIAACFGKELLDRKLAQALLPIMPLLLGAAFGAVPGFFEGYSILPRLLIGMVAGFFSPRIYFLVRDRFPQILATKGMAGRVDGPAVAVAEGEPDNAVEGEPPQGGC